MTTTNADAHAAGLAAVMAMINHDLTCAGNGYTMPKDKATLTCGRCGAVVYDGPYLGGRARGHGRPLMTRYKRHQTKAGKRFRQRRHAILRASERYGVTLAINDYLRICDRLWSHLHGVDDPGVETVASFKNPKYFIWHHGCLFLATWDPDTCQITTFLSRADRIADRGRVILTRNTPKHLRWKLDRERAAASRMAGIT
jgi:hypothetical protein